jgi:dihydroorotate dehydrogenase
MLLPLLLVPGLRALQGRQQLQDLVTFVKTTRDNLDWGPGGPPPLLVKIAPDVTDADKADIAAVVAATQVDGLVVGNTTISRPGASRAAAGCMWWKLLLPFT